MNNSKVEGHVRLGEHTLARAQKAAENGAVDAAKAWGMVASAHFAAARTLAVLGIGVDYDDE
jgi:hypothetical protein